MTNREVNLLILFMTLFASSIIYERISESIKTQSKIQRLELELSQVPKVCLRQFKGDL